MFSHESESKKLDSRAVFLPYMLSLLVAMTAIQVLIAVTGGEITLVATIALAVVAIAMVIWVLVNYKVLRRIRFGSVLANVIGFVVVTTSFNLHALIRVIVLSEQGAAATAEAFFGTAWFGLTLGMSAIWGVGVIFHLVGSVLGRGWDD